MDRKNQKIKKTVFITFVSAALIVTAAGLIYRGIYRRTYSMTLPRADKIQSILLKRDGEKTVVTERGDIEAILQILKGEGRTSHMESIQDCPVNTDEIIHLEFEFAEAGASTLFVYRRGNRYYMEQPYNGIFNMDRDEYDFVSGFLT